MALPALITKLEDVAEGFRGEYVKGDGSDARPDADKYYLDVKPTDGITLEDTSGLRNTIGKLRGEVRTLKRDAEAFKGLDAEAARDALARLGEIEKEGGTSEDVQKKLEALKKQLGDVHAQEKRSLEAERAEIEEALSKALIDAAVTEAVGGKGSVKLLLPAVRGRVRVVKTEAGDRVARVYDGEGNELISRKPGSNGVPMDVAEYVESLRSDADYARAFDGSGPSGGGTSGMGEERQKGTGAGRETKPPISTNPVERLKRARREQEETEA